MRNDAEVKSKISALEEEVLAINKILYDIPTNEDVWALVTKARNIELFITMLKIYFTHRTVVALFIGWITRGDYSE